MSTPAIRDDTGIDLKQLPKGDLLPWALGYQARFAAEISFSLLLAAVCDSPWTMVVLWLAFAWPVAMIVSGLFFLHGPKASAALAALAVASFQIDWRFGVSGLVLLAFLYAMAFSTAYRLERMRTEQLLRGTKA